MAIDMSNLLCPRQMETREVVSLPPIAEQPQSALNGRYTLIGCRCMERREEEPGLGNAWRPVWLRMGIVQGEGSGTATAL